MKNICFIIFSTLLFWGCHNSKNIEGHWHLKPKFAEFEYHTLDISNQSDTLVYSEKYTFEPYQIRHEPKEKYLIFGGCGGFFSYTAGPKSLLLKNVQDYGDYIGEKHELTNAHILEDYKKNLIIDVRFPEIANQSLVKIDEIPIGAGIENIIIGRPKPKKNVFFIDRDRIQVRHEYIDIENLEKFLDKVKGCYTNENLPFVSFRLISDKNVSGELIFSIKEKLNKANFKRVYLTFLKKDIQELGNLFEYIDLKNIELNSDKNINDMF
ncbi:hypothetical protein TPENAI_20199 [Tenacibaculum litopenaei]|uniref:hypothetical protein n=1 Tax=Tenacibaculum litopenaei TaxID=396016 RepID=UPI0038966F79